MITRELHPRPRGSRGIDDREVRANRIRKSVGAENTFSSDLTDFEAMLSEMQPLIDKVWRHCEDIVTRCDDCGTHSGRRTLMISQHMSGIAPAAACQRSR